MYGAWAKNSRHHHKHESRQVVSGTTGPDEAVREDMERVGFGLVAVAFQPAQHAKTASPHRDPFAPPRPPPTNRAGSLAPRPIATVRRSMSGAHRGRHPRTTPTLAQVVVGPAGHCHCRPSCLVYCKVTSWYIAGKVLLYMRLMITLFAVGAAFLDHVDSGWVAMVRWPCPSS